MARLFGLLACVNLAVAACISSGDETTINNALQSGGQGAVVQLCPNAVILVHNTVTFTAANQELSTQGYPTDGTRGIVRLQATDPSITAVISGGNINGIRLRNIQIDGDRTANGLINDGSSANIEVGGIQNGLFIDHVASMNPRGWSCMHIIEGGAATGAASCTNATVTNNDIGPCGQEGTDANGNGKWADGISFGCTNSLVQGNTITGSTDGGIVIFGAPGTQVISNTIVGSTTNAGFGGINLVDNLAVYGGSFANVEVSSNIIQGQRLFGAGIAIGSCVWTSCDASSTTPPLSGPVTISNNVFSGSIAFPIPISGWTGGITVTGNSVSGVGSNTAFSEDGNCPPPTQAAFSANQHLLWNSPSVTGATNLQTGFVQHTDYPSFFICPTPPLPSQQTWLAGALALSTLESNPTFSQLHNGFDFVFDGSAQLIVYDNGNVQTTIGAANSDTCNSECNLDFQGDGNLVKYLNGAPFWDSGTAGQGSTLTAMITSPWLEIKDQTGAVIWDGVNGLA